MKAIGLDIGTTSICGILMDGENGEVLQSLTLPNQASVPGRQPYEHCQDPEKIYDTILAILDQLSADRTDIGSIGLDGQMHGILYVDARGRALSPLYTWQDESGNCAEVESGKCAEVESDDCPEVESGDCATRDIGDCRKKDSGYNFAHSLSEKTGYPMASGYGLTTVYCHTVQGKIPEHAAHICTISDYVFMRLTGLETPVITPSNAASLGLFDLEKSAFDENAVKAAGISLALLPHIVEQQYRPCTEIFSEGRLTGTPVACALGDNQASVIGSVQDTDNTILLNVGTGSQISVGTKILTKTEIEIRPLTGPSYMYVGAALCGGRSYALLEQFFQGVLRMAGVESDDRLYDCMARCLEYAEVNNSGLQVAPLFCGTRQDPSLTGSITGITLDNFTPESMIRGFLEGMAQELYAMYTKVEPSLPSKPGKLVGSGNGIRKNPHLKAIMEQKFGLPMAIPAHTEEAAYGSALFSLVCAGHYETIEEAQKLIRFTRTSISGKC